MKQIIKQTFLALCLMVCAVTTNAYDFKVDGIYYEIISENTVQVTYEESSVSKYDSNVYYYSNYSGSIKIPEIVTYNGKSYSVVGIRAHAFQGCSSLTSVTIPNSVTSIGYYAFYGCSGLTSVTISDGVTSIQDDAFNGCSGLTSVTIPNSVTSIGAYAFYACSGLTSVTISDGVTSIGSGAFWYCSGLTSVTIPSSVKSIGNYAFYDVKKVFFLTNTKPSIANDVHGNSYAFKNCDVYYTANNDSYGIPGIHKVYPLLSSIFEVDGMKYIPVSMSERTCDFVDVDCSKIFSNPTVDSSVKYTNSSGRQFDFKVCNVNAYAGYGMKCSTVKSLSKLSLKNEGDIESYAFVNSTPLSIDVSNTVKNICSCAFIDCTKTKAIVVSNDGSIGSNAFKGCTAVTSIIASNNGYIGDSAFKDCKSATSIIVSNKGSIGMYAFSGCASNESISSASISISNTKDVGNYAFQGCTKAKVVTLGNEITSLGSRCFLGCSSVENIKLGANIASMGSYCFDYCRNLKSIELNDLITSIGSYTFSGCEKLENMTIPANVTSIASNAFDGCTSIENLTFEDSNTAISLGCKFIGGKNLYLGRDITFSMYKESPFSGNNVLEKVTTNNNVTKVYDYEFYNCKNLKDIYISDAVTSIGTYAFSGDVALEKFEVGENIKSIGAESFSDCTALLDFISHAKVPATVGTEALDDINKLECTLHIPAGTSAAYKAAAQWKEFWMEEDATGIESVTEALSNKFNKGAYKFFDGKGIRIINKDKAVELDGKVIE